MNTTRRFGLTLPAIIVSTLLAATPEAAGQRGEPHVGYVYPAGLARGSSVEVTVGGQFLQGTGGARITGEGVDLEVVRYIPALTKGRTVRLVRMLRALREKRSGKLKRNEAGGGKTPKANPNADTKAKPADKKRKALQDIENVTPESVVAEARRFGLEVNTVLDVVKVLRKTRDPKNQPSDQIDERVVLKISAAPDAPLGRRELRLSTPQGLTNGLVFQVGPYREWTEDEPDGGGGEVTLEGALPMVVNGQIMPGDVDRYRFRAAKGAKLVASVNARALVPYLADAVPGWFQATLALYDAEGNRLAYCDDRRYDPDPVIAHVIPADGEYVLEIADSIYRGRDDFVYRITVGETPFITGIYPLGGPADTQTTVRLTGWNLPVREVTVDPAADAADGVVPVSVRAGDAVSNVALFAVGSLEEATEREPNDDADNARRVDWPVTVNGRIDRPGDRDVYRIEGRAGEAVVIEVQARQLASPVDSLVMLTDAEGRLLAANDDHEDKGRGLMTHHADSRLTHTFNKTGPALVRVSDAQNAGGTDYAYRLRIDRPHPGFDLRAMPANLNVPPGGVAEVTVHALRRDGFTGDIALVAKNLPDGFTTSGGRIPAGVDRVRMTLAAPRPRRGQDAPSGSFALHIEGIATVNGQTLREVALPAEDRMQAFLWRFLVPKDEGLITVAGRRRWMPPIVFTPAPVTIPAGGSTQVKVSGPRGFLLKRIELELDDPPAGVTLRDVAIDPRNGIALTLAADAEALTAAPRGNLIVAIFTRPPAKGKDGKPRRNVRRFKVGIMPALPYEVVGE